VPFTSVRHLLVTLAAVMACLAAVATAGTASAHANAASPTPSSAGLRYTHSRVTRFPLPNAKCSEVRATYPSLKPSDCYVTVVTTWTDPVRVGGGLNGVTRANGITPYDNQCATLSSQFKQTYYGPAHIWQTSQQATFAFSSGGCFQPYVVQGTHACAMDDHYIFPTAFQLTNCRDYNSGSSVVAEEDFLEGTTSDLINPAEAR